MNNRSFSQSRTLLVSTCAVLLGASAVACGAEDVPSTDVKTSGMYAKFEALDSGNGNVAVTAELRVGGNNGTYVRLVDGEELVSSLDGDEAVMGEEGSGDRVWYVTDYAVDDSSDATVGIAFNRNEEEVSTESTAWMPPAFSVSLDGPDAGDDIQRGTDVIVTWDTEYSGRMFWEVDGDCVWSESGEVQDSGDLTLTADDVRVTGTGEGETCEVTVTLERRLEGEVDEAFEQGGQFVAIQRRAIKFMSTPADGEGEGMGGSGS